MSLKESPKIVACNSNPKLAKDIADYLHLPLTEATIRHFSDHEIFVEILENVRGEDVFVVQSTCNPANDHLMELLITIDALRRGSAGRITAVIPYFGYARQDRKSGPRTPISAKLVANMITKAGADRILTMDMHAGQLQGFFDIPVDNLSPNPIFSKDIRTRFAKDNILVMSPDIGGVKRARSLASRIDADLAIVDKRRPEVGESEVMHIIGNVAGRDCLIMDDIIDTAGTMCNAAEAIMAAGARSVSAYATHGVFSGQAFERVMKSSLEKCVITDTIPASESVLNAPSMDVLSVAQIMGEAVIRISEERSVSVLFN
jgi:ribose-phosphate pyrophosphokinase